MLSVGPLLGSFITEPAAMTLAALLLRQRFFSRNAPASFMYVTVGVLFVNISIGGTLTPYAAPPVLMVADKWGLDLVTMLATFGWKAALAVLVNAAAAALAYRTFLSSSLRCAGAGEARGAALGGRRASGLPRGRRDRSAITPSSSSPCSCSSSASRRPTAATRAA